MVVASNPVVSQGTLVHVVDVAKRIEEIRARGGRVVVVDPRRSETAEIADEHVAVRPGTDALLLAGMVHALFEGDLVNLGRLAEWTRGVDDVCRAIEPFAPERVASRCGFTSPDTMRRAFLRRIGTGPSDYRERFRR